ncbi:preprotein translocase subunit SecE [Ureaplasma parvum]|nr:preprotein translocase subunit SecE [Ureaplasma parvum]
MVNDKKQKSNKYLTYQDQEYERNLLLEKERKQQKKILAQQAYQQLDLNKKLIKKAKNDQKLILRLLKEDKSISKTQFNTHRIELKNTIDQMIDENYELLEQYSVDFEKISFKLKRWLYGINKEIRRTTWASKRSVIISLIIVIVIVLILAAIFFGIDTGFYKLSAK